MYLTWIVYAYKLYMYAGLKVNDQLVAYATRFSAVRLKNHVWSHHRALKEKVIPKGVYFLTSPIKSLYCVELLTEVSASKVHSTPRN